MKKRNVQAPLFDINEYAFADDATQEIAKIHYAKDMEKYIFKKMRLKIIIISSVILVIACIIIGLMFYNKGFSDNQSYAEDGSPIVVITKSGSKYHKKNCKYISSNGIEISRTNAQKHEYGFCSVCRPDRIK